MACSERYMPGPYMAAYLLVRGYMRLFRGPNRGVEKRRTGRDLRGAQKIY